MAKQAKPSFEEGLVRIEEIVGKLDQGTATLQESLALFEEGSKLIRSCAGQLKDYEQKVVKLMKAEDGTPQELPFEEA